MSQFFPGPGPLQDEFESAKEEITALNDNIAKVQNGLAYIVGDTNTTGGTLAVGAFVYAKGHASIAEGLRKVTANISANGRITTSNTEACPEGGLNALNSNIQNSSKGKRYHVYGVATAVQVTEIRFFLPLTNYDGTAAVTVHAFGLTNIWSTSEGASHVTVIGNSNGGVAFKATGDSGTFVPTASYYYDLDVTIN